LTGYAEAPGDDLIVSFGLFAEWEVQLEPEVVGGTFMHELGHNLGLDHGGGDWVNQKPNYPSVMNYSYQFGIPMSNAPGPFPTTADRSIVSSRRLDYSGSELRVLDENVLDERVGINGPPAGRDLVQFYYRDGGSVAYGPSNGSPIDWNMNRLQNEQGVRADISGDGVVAGLTGFGSHTARAGRDAHDQPRHQLPLRRR
jgi:hypothetical protein